MLSCIRESRRSFASLAGALRSITPSIMLESSAMKGTNAPPFLVGDHIAGFAAQIVGRWRRPQPVQQSYFKIEQKISRRKLSMRSTREVK